MSLPQRTLVVKGHFDPSTTLQGWLRYCSRHLCSILGAYMLWQTWFIWTWLLSPPGLPALEPEPPALRYDT
ncbi:hypothetical protein ASPBRDRAFT_603400 [Aspergillus brasiliensis CBS 101740]|uniref:Uncharacterized protein n=1 Tax=Aspergillus brasiliensis (strain CBS 101740 / IMI 381727 / IBT 21946) TaxID=767769 RepID=A0A1L9UHH1_ASPBC|nr:hypothetical protein ASPBRDRAFT_603400 [Aspergillus brasiliensis CBS 101740]